MTESSEPGPAPERLGIGDLPACRALSDAAGWNQTDADWAVFLRHGRVYGHRRDGRAVASAAVLPFDADIAWISMVLTLPEARGHGLGAALTAAAFADAEADGRVAWLDATPAGEPIYRQLGFAGDLAMTRWRAEAPDPGGEAAAMPAPELDLEAAVALDARCLGAPRRFLLAAFLNRPGTRVLSLDGGAGGFAMARAGRLAEQIGPVVAPDPEAAWALIGGLVRSGTGPQVIDLLDDRPELASRLRSAGFAPVRPFRRMRRGPQAAADTSLLHAAAGPEFG